MVLNTIVHHAPDAVEAVAQLARFERYCCTPSVAVEIMRRGHEADLTPFLPLIQAPTLVINNRDDPIAPLDQATYLAEHIPGARQVIIEGDYHASWRSSDYDEPLSHIEEFLTGERGAAVTAFNRVLSTVVFTDVVGSTNRAVDLGDANWRQILDRYEGVCRNEVSRHRGVFVQQTGDGMLAHFDSPGRAVACALTLNERVGALGLRTRSGVHTGEVELRGPDLERHRGAHRGEGDEHRRRRRGRRIANRQGPHDRRQPRVRRPRGAQPQRCPWVVAPVHCPLTMACSKRAASVQAADDP